MAEERRLNTAQNSRYQVAKSQDPSKTMMSYKSLNFLQKKHALEKII